MLKELQDIAFRIHIDPLKTVGHAAKVNTVIKVLSEISKSYNNYVEIEFLKNKDFKKAYDKNKKVLEAIKEDLDLLIVDLNFSSFEAALAPDLSVLHSPMFKDEVHDWKKGAYDNYKDLFINANLDDFSYIQNIGKKYTPEERFKIFHPLFVSYGDGKEYKVNLKNEKHKVIKNLILPQKASIDFYIPKTHIVKEDPIYNTVQMYAKVKKDGDNSKLNKRSIKDVLYYEVMEHETYPFKPEFIKFENTIFILNHKLECTVEFEEQNYIIKNELLDIVVWGETREIAEDAFNFNFYSLYLNYYLEKDSKLSAKAKTLKKQLKTIIQKVVDEA